jgi:hypothetical protein
MPEKRWRDYSVVGSLGYVPGAACAKRCSVSTWPGERADCVESDCESSWLWRRRQDLRFPRLQVQMSLTW